MFMPGTTVSEQQETVLAPKKTESALAKTISKRKKNNNCI
uniref:Uncharacterized protein n=1 Tax=Anguilla anguilla TaxID=7936 RepID=A0A0E9XDS7_ANGAN